MAKFNLVIGIFDILAAIALALVNIDPLYWILIIFTFFIGVWNIYVYNEFKPKNKHQDANSQQSEMESKK